eukprot:c25502_g1_i1 orf=84-251(+)
MPFICHSHTFSLRCMLLLKNYEDTMSSPTTSIVFPLLHPCNSPLMGRSFFNTQRE